MKLFEVKHLSPSNSCESAFNSYPKDQIIRLIEDCSSCQMASICAILNNFFASYMGPLLSMLISSYLSGLFLMFVGFFILLNKKFQKHPYSLIGWACICNAIGFFLRYSNFLVCFFDLPWLFQLSVDPYYYLVNGTVHPIMIWNKFQSIYISWKIVSYISIYLNLAANSLIFIDLYLTIRNPFY